MTIDPCAEAARLRTLRDQIILGGQPIRIREGDRETQFGPADLRRLDSLIAEQEAACARVTGVRRGRSARRMKFF